MKRIIALIIVFLMLFTFFAFSPITMGRNIAKTVNAEVSSGSSRSLEHGMGCIPAPKGKYPQINTQKLKDDLLSKGVNPQALPSRFDLSSEEPPVGNQGQQGSCTAWATAYYYKTYQEGKEQNWDLTKNSHQFSPAFVYNQINGGHDQGSSILDALQLMVNKGCDTLAVFPYDDQDCTMQPTQEQLDEALPFKADSYANFFQGQGNCADDTINTLKEWLANGDTFVIAIPVYDEFAYAPPDPNYVEPPHNPNDPSYGGHALQVCGYNDNLYYTDNNNVKHYGAFKIINSWGSGFGYNGYINISYDFFKQDVWEAWSMTDDATPNDFVVGVDPLRQEVMAGHSATSTIDVTGLSEFNGNVSLSVSGLPSGITATLSSTSCTPNPDAQVTLTFNIDSSVAAGEYDFTVSGTSGSITHRISGKLEVEGDSGILIHVKNHDGKPAVGAYIWLYSDTSKKYPDFSNKTDDTGSVYFPKASGNYTALIFSETDHLGIQKSLSAPGEYTIDTTNTREVVVTTKKTDGSALGGRIWFVPFKNGVLDVANSSGTTTVYITPGTYSVMAFGYRDHYQLSKTNIDIPASGNGAVNVTLDASSMPVGTITMNFDGFNSGYIIAWPTICNWSSTFYTKSGTTFTYSADTYNMHLRRNKDVQDSSSWFYDFKLTDDNVTVSSGSSSTITSGGTLSAASQPDKTTYTIGDTVGLTNKVADAHGNRLVFLNEHMPSAFNPALPQKLGNPLPQVSHSYGPLVTVKGPNGHTYYQDDSMQEFYSTSFVTNSNWPTGNYTVDISLYTGPLQGTVAGNTVQFTLNPFPKDAYEPDNDPAHAALITTDGTVQTHNFDVAGDVDWIKFNAVGYKTYTIDTLNLGSNCNTQITLYAPDGTTFIDFNDDFDSLASRIDFECPQGKDGTYYIKVQNCCSRYGANTNYDISVYPAIKISFSDSNNSGKDFGISGQDNNVTVTVTQDGNPLQNASVYCDFDGSTQTTDASGQVTFNVNPSQDGYTYFEVTYGNYKRCYDYFLVVDSNTALIKVKPKDINGYYLTNFDFEVANPNWGSWSGGSGYHNTKGFPVKAGNDVVAVSKSDYRSNDIGYYMVKSALTTASAKTTVPFDASTDTVTLNVTGQLDSSPLTDARVELRDEGFDYHAYFAQGYTDSSGKQTVYVTPGTYTAVLIQDNRNGDPDVVLVDTGVPISTDTNHTVSYASSQLGTLNRHAYDGKGNEIWLSLYATINNNIWLFDVGQSSRYEPVLLSPGNNYCLNGTQSGIDANGDEWYYHFVPTESFDITAGSTQEVDFGGPLTMSINFDKSSYNPGDTVNIKVPIKDQYNHYFDHMEHYSSSSSSGNPSMPNKNEHNKLDEFMEQHNNPDLMEGNHYVNPSTSAPSSGWEHPRIHLTVKDPNGNTVVDTSGYDSRYLRENGYNYTLPSDAPNGTYTVTATLNVGPYNSSGTVTQTNTFTVSNTPPLTIHLTGNKFNLVSFPFTVTSTDVPNLVQAYSFDWTSGWAFPTTFEPGKGYWIEVSQDEDVTLTGTSSSVDVTVSVKPGGFNLLGNPFNTPIDISALNEANGNHILKIYTFDWTNGWQTWAPNGEQDFTTLEPGKGYWILLDSTASTTFVFPAP